MIKIFKGLFRHRCRFDTPIVSMYTSFNTRDIIYQCRCGNKKVYEIYKDFDSPFPIPTDVFMKYKQFKRILESKEHYKKPETIY